METEEGDAESNRGNLLLHGSLLFMAVSFFFEFAGRDDFTWADATLAQRLALLSFVAAIPMLCASFINSHQRYNLGNMFIRINAIVGVVASLLGFCAILWNFQSSLFIIFLISASFAIVGLRIRKNEKA